MIRFDSRSDRDRDLFRSLVFVALFLVAADNASAQLAPNQTLGFGNGRLVTFTYLQNFDCVTEPFMDLYFNGIKAQSDPTEMQTPICQVITEPTTDPSGGDLKHTAQLYVLVPMFGSDTNPADAMPCPGTPRPDELCGVEAWKTKPAVATQCPDPNNPVPGTCTMHASSVDLSVLLATLGKIENPPTGNVFLPTPNHDHIVDNSRINTKPIWWQVRPVLVMDATDWPAADGSSGLTSATAMDAAEEAGRAVEVGSNFFLFFSARISQAAMHHP